MNFNLIFILFLNINNFIDFKKKLNKKKGDWGLGIRDWGLRIGD